MLMIQDGMIRAINPFNIFDAMGRVFVDNVEATKPYSYTKTDGEFTTTQRSSSCFEVTDGERSVEIAAVNFPHLGELWIASAKWDKKCFSEPMNSFQDAENEAKVMLGTHRP